MEAHGLTLKVRRRATRHRAPLPIPSFASARRPCLILGVSPAQVEPHTQRVPRSQRGGEVIEPLVSTQVSANSLSLIATTSANSYR